MDVQGSLGFSPGNHSREKPIPLARANVERCASVLAEACLRCDGPAPEDENALRHHVDITAAMMLVSGRFHVATVLAARHDAFRPAERIVCAHVQNGDDSPAALRVEEEAMWALVAADSAPAVVEEPAFLLLLAALFCLAHQRDNGPSATQRRTCLVRHIAELPPIEDPRLIELLCVALWFADDEGFRLSMLREYARGAAAGHFS